MYYWEENPGLLYDSKGEAHIHYYFLELESFGYIDKIELQPNKLVIAPPLKRTVVKPLKTK